MRNLLLALSMIIMTSPVSLAQKVAHADVNAILSVMPENKKINEDLQIYATGLQKRLDDMKAQLDMMGKEFQKVLGSGDTAQALQIQQKAVEQDKKLQEAAKESEQQLAQKRNEALKPVLDRIHAAIKAVAKGGGFDLVLNSVDGSGTSIVLWSPEGNNITEGVVKELGIEFKPQDGAPSPEPPADNNKKRK